MLVLSRPTKFGKLERYGLRAVALKFIKSYFSNRKQYVNYSETKSDLLIQNLGVVLLYTKKNVLQKNVLTKCSPSYFDIYSSECVFLYAATTITFCTLTTRVVFMPLMILLF